MNTLNILKRTFRYSYRQVNKKCFSTKMYPDKSNRYDDIPYPECTCSFKIKPDLAIIKNIEALHMDSENIDYKKSLCKWEDLKGKKILNKNILIEGFGNIDQFPNPPLFTGAENIFLRGNHKYFYYYWLNETVFPTNPILYLDGHPRDLPVYVLYRGFKIYVVGSCYYRTIRYANEIGADTSLIHRIEQEVFDDIIYNYNIENIVLKDYEQCDIIKSNGIIRI